MHTNDLRKLARETNDGVLRGPALGAADEIDRLRAEIERLTKAHDTVCGALATAIEKHNQALTDAERDMRQRAADLCDCACMDGIGDKIRAIGDEILALPLKHADREGSAARAALAGKGEA